MFSSPLTPLPLLRLWLAMHLSNVFLDTCSLVAVRDPPQVNLNVIFFFFFYRIAPAMLRQASYGTIKIGTYQSFKRLLVERPEGEAHFLSVIVQA